MQFLKTIRNKRRDLSEIHTELKFMKNMCQLGSKNKKKVLQLTRACILVYSNGVLPNFLKMQKTLKPAQAHQVVAWRKFSFAKKFTTPNIIWLV